MGLEESQKHLLSLSYHSLQSLCKKYNLPANKGHSQLATSLALLLEKENLNSEPQRENMFASTQASPATSSALLSNIKEASKRGQDNHKRDPYSDRDDDDDDRPHVKHKKGPRIQMDKTLDSEFGTRMSLPPVSINNGKADCFSCSSSGQGIAHNLKSQSADGIATNLTARELAIGSHDSAAHVNDKISFVASHPGPNGMVSEPLSRTKVGGNGIDKGSGSSNQISANKNPPFQLFVMSEEGINLVVDLNSTPAAWIDTFKGGVSVPQSTHHSETGIFSNSISSLLSKSDKNTISSSGNIIRDIENKGAESIAPCTNSSLGSTDGENSRSQPYPPDTTAVNSRSSAPTLPGTQVEISGSQVGVPVVHSSCLTSDVQNNMSPDMMDGALGNNVLPQESVDVSVWSERSHAPLADGSIQPTSNKGTFSPGKTKVSVKIGCTQNVLDAYSDKATAFSSGYVVISDSDENSCPPSVGKQEMIDVTSGVQLTHNSDTNELLMENEPMEEVPLAEDNGHGDRLSVCQLARQTVTELPATDAKSDASSADRCVAGNFDRTDPTPSSAASDNAITPQTAKHGAKTARSHDSVDKKRARVPEELQGVPTRNILHSLRSASARQTKPSSLPRRSARLVPK